MFSIEQVISSGTQLLFTDEKKFHFKLKTLSFEKVNMSEVDTPDQIESDEGGAYWLMKIEVISLYYRKIETRQVTDDIALIDSDGFQFNVQMDFHLSAGSRYSKQVGLSRFYKSKKKILQPHIFLQKSYRLKSTFGLLMMIKAA